MAGQTTTKRANGAGRLSGWRQWTRRLRGALEREGPRVTTEVRRAEGPIPYLDPAVVMKLGLSPLVARCVVEGFLSGLHRSPFRGFSVEFADHREYVPGDDLKFLDWMLYARTDHYYIKRSEEETNVRCYLMLDRSASMAFGTGGVTKWDYACFLGSCLAYLMLKQQDAVSLALFGAQPGVMVPPRCRSTHLHQIMRTMAQFPPSGGTNLPGSLQALVRRLKRRGLVVLLSDLLDQPEETLRAIRLIRSHRHDAIVFHLQDEAERVFNFEGAARFRDVETGEELVVDPAAIRETYQEEMAALEDFYRRGLAEMKIDYVPVNTREPYDAVFRAYLRRRAAMHR